MNTFVLWVHLVLGAPQGCAWRLPPVGPEAALTKKPDGRLEFIRRYPSLWAACALRSGGPAPVLKIEASDARGRWTLNDEVIDLHPSLSPERFARVRALFDVCKNREPRRNKDAILRGPVGRTRFENPTKVEVVLQARGRYQPLSYRTEADWFCPSCPKSPRAASISFYRVTGRSGPTNNQVRFRIALDKTAFKCASGGGSIELRHYFIDSSSDPWRPLKPVKTVRHFEKKLRPVKDEMVFESFYAPQAFCKKGQKFVWEVAGLGTFAHLVNRSGYGPSRFVRRGTIEFLRCPL